MNLTSHNTRLLWSQPILLANYAVYMRDEETARTHEISPDELLNTPIIKKKKEFLHLKLYFPGTLKCHNIKEREK